jgi:universal stress protein E
MQKLSSILVVLDRRATGRYVLAKAIVLARHFHAKVELFLCDSEHAYALRHAYDVTGVRKARDVCLADSQKFLESVRLNVAAEDVRISTHAACESPLYEGIVQRVLETCPDLVIKEVGGDRRLGTYSNFDANDWQLARTCPVPLMLTRGRPWRPQPRFAAALDLSEQETPGLANAIANTSEYLAAGCHAELELLYCERASSASRERDDRRSQLQALGAAAHVARDHIHVLNGEPEATLPSFAFTRHYDVMILGALTHRKGMADLVGTLTSTLADTVDCDFVLVKPGAYSCPVHRPAVRAFAGERA